MENKTPEERLREIARLADMSYQELINLTIQNEKNEEKITKKIQEARQNKVSQLQYETGLRQNDLAQKQIANQTTDAEISEILLRRKLKHLNRTTKFRKFFGLAY